ncbi:heme-binding protein soul4 [Pseudochaenichthys georgianus]|uniref:heme-binding protein soul4 n=1 Tax=Pseudochaenichthys georgianus TaxID=52239 RepID=UPI00146F33D8|nr:heme-binding protein soul4 [Pseudochaenichthys georgianus]
MMAPIMEMTRNSQQRELLQFSSICCHEKMGEVQFEERLIPPGQWACVSAGEKLFEQSVSVSFMKLMRYICRENSTGRFLGLTVPVVTEVSADGLSMQEVVRTSFFLPSEFQSAPPLPSDPDITIVQREPIRVLSRTFFGTTTWQTLTYQVGILRGLLGAPPLLGTPPLLGAPPLLENFMVASYENPSVPERRNEIWILP